MKQAGNQSQRDLHTTTHSVADEISGRALVLSKLATVGLGVMYWGSGIGKTDTLSHLHPIEYTHEFATHGNELQLQSYGGYGSAIVFMAH